MCGKNINNMISKCFSLQKTKGWRYSVIWAIIALSIHPSRLLAETYFNPALLKSVDSGAPAVTPSMLARLSSGQQIPGNYWVDIYVNGDYQGSQELDFATADAKGELVPSLSANDLLALKFKSSVLEKNGIALSPEHAKNRVVGLLQQVHGVSATFDFSQHRYNITVPEIYLQKYERDVAASQLWDEGLTAAMVNYSFNGVNTHSRGDALSPGSNSYFLSLDSGVNLGLWQFRNFSTWSYNEQEHRGSEISVSGSQQHWQSINSYARHQVEPLNGMLTLGDWYTASDVFDSVQFRGANLATDSDMLSSESRYYSPVIRGMAATNARVVVYQNGNKIYETTVPPGSFAISDITTASLSGDLDVTVYESDGSSRSFVVGNSSIAIMQREGEFTYDLTVGKLRNTGMATQEPPFAQLTGIYGMPWDFTLYGGGLYSDDYYALSTGIGTGLGQLGAISVDVTQSYATLGSDETSQGQSWRMRYSKNIQETGTQLTLATYRYSTEGYYSFQDANALKSNAEKKVVNASGVWYQPVVHGRAQQEYQLSVSQQLGDFGTLSFNGTRRSFWDINGNQHSFSLNYRTSIRRINFGFGYSDSSWPGTGRPNDKMISANIQLPLQNWLGTEHALWAGSSYRNNEHGSSSTNMNVGGTLLEDNVLSWNASQALSQNNEYHNKSSSSVNASYRGVMGDVTAGYNYSSDSSQLNYGVRGGVLATRYGVTLSQPLGETIALIRAPGANGVSVRSRPGVITDWRGYAVQADVSPYNFNKIYLDPMTAGEDVQLNNASKTVVPVRGAVVLANFDTQVGKKAYMTLSHKGKPLPLGTMVSISKGNGKKSSNEAIVGDAGAVYLAGLAESGQLIAKWGEQPDEQCDIDYRITEQQVELAKEKRLPVLMSGECK